jgi:hypothetical protein
LVGLVGNILDNNNNNGSGNDNDNDNDALITTYTVGLHIISQVLRCKTFLQS